MTGPGAQLVAAATRRPQPGTPPRVPSSIRRASHIGVRLPDGTPTGMSALTVHGAVRDVVTDATGSGRIVGEATLDCVVAPDRTVTDITADPPTPRLSELVGRLAHRGWRAAARDVVGAESVLASLLDDVPIAVMLSSYGALRQGRLEPAAVRPLMLHMRDVCAGWAGDATPMRTLEAGAPLPLPGVVPAPADSGTDPLTAERRGPLAVGEVRRSRRLDVVTGERVRVSAGFRDSWHDPAAGEGILHEYTVDVVIDHDGVIEEIVAEPRVLPYDECTLAVAAPQRLVGQDIGGLRESVAAAAGRSTCTHLDDLLRTLVAVPGLLARATAGDAGSTDW